MPFVPVPDSVEVEMRMLLDAQHIENTLYFNQVGGWTIADMTALANALLIWWTTQYSDQASVQLSLNEIKVTDLSSATASTVTVPAPTPHPVGSDAFQALPNNCTVCVSIRTNLRGRSFRGRNYYAGISENVVDQNTVQAAALAVILAAYNGLFTVASTLGVDWVVVSRFSGVDAAGKPIPRTTGISTLVASVAIVDPVIDSQRRRLPGRGQ